MTGKNITYKTRKDESFTGMMFEPDGSGKVPGLLLITAIFGIDEEMVELSQAWANDGFLVSTPDIFWRQMPGPTADFQKALQRYEAFEPEQGMRDIEDLMNHLRAHPRCNGKIAVLGFCFGGKYAHLAAARLGANAAAAFHGTMIGGSLNEMPPKNCPISFHFGAEDPIVPMAEVDQIKQAYAGHANAQIVVHAGASHNFSMPKKQGYDAAAAASSRAAALKAFRSM
ncbi:MAG: dienelactone hydrolase family protein [Alphaproteobacteria bacterium]|nr:dienelactone hydrolase family protein [Alphaproteobacteria bacterium]